MPIKQAAWTHGLSVELENRSWGALRQAFGTQIIPSNESTFGWIHFAIPTPVIVDGARLKAVQAGIRFSTGSGAKITNFHVYDGENKIAEYNNIAYTGALQTQFQPVTGSPQIFWGTGISLGVRFDGTGSNDWVEVVSAGIDFYN